MLCYVINDLVFTILEICEDEAYLQHHWKGRCIWHVNCNDNSVNPSIHPLSSCVKRQLNILAKGLSHAVFPEVDLKGGRSSRFRSSPPHRRRHGSRFRQCSLSGPVHTGDNVEFDTFDNRPSWTCSTLATVSTAINCRIRTSRRQSTFDKMARNRRQSRRPKSTILSTFDFVDYVDFRLCRQHSPGQLWSPVCTGHYESCR